MKKAQEKRALTGLLCIGSPEPIERNPFNCVRLSSVSELNRTQSDRLSSICSIEFDLWCSIEFDFRTFDLLCREILMKKLLNLVEYFTEEFHLGCTIERFHMTSWQPNLCSKTMKRRPCWFPKPILFLLMDVT